MTTIKTQMHTVIMLIGPTGSGKSVLAKAIATNARAKYLGIDPVIISSDELRNHFIPMSSFTEYDKQSQVMGEVSAAAFLLLEQMLQLHMDWPVNSPLIILDTTGLNEQFREMVLKYANHANYNVDAIVFDYTWSTYLSVVEEYKHPYVRSQIKRLKQNVMPTMNRKKYANVTTIKHRDTDYFADVDIVINNYDLFSKCNIPIENNQYSGVTVIGDVHECVDALKELVNLIPSESLIVLIGDLVDKGGKTHETIAYVLELMKQRHVMLVKGNHENYVYKRIHNMLPAKHHHPELEQEFFTSVQTLLDGTDEQRAAFDEIVHSMLPFVRILPSYYSRSVFIAHAPQQLPRDLTKLDDRSVKNQMYMYMDRSEEAAREWIDGLKKTAIANMPYRVYGHVAHNSKSMMYKNIVMLDTGAVYGNKLSAITFHSNGKYTINQVNCAPIDNAPEIPLFNLMDGPAPERQSQLVINEDMTPREKISAVASSRYNLSDDDEKRLVGLIYNKIRYISGTMVPAPAKGDDIESFDAAIEYFKSNNVTTLFLEPKYMGSRCQLYLFADDSIPGFAVSRNGFKIKIPDIDTIVEYWTWKMKNEFPEWTTSIILDGELLPWRALGGRLIDDEFTAFSECVKYELNALDNNETWKSFDIGIEHELNTRHDMLKVFNEQLELFGVDVAMSFSPFDILDVDGNSYAGTKPTSEIFQQLCTIAYGEQSQYATIIDLDDEKSIQHGKDTYMTISNVYKMEGIVLKPEHVVSGEDIHYAPYMKVRNHRYLTLVYGYDYKLRNKVLCESKNIRNKLKTSINEYNIGQHMLKATTEEERINQYCKMLFELNKEKTFDPRL